MKEPGRRKELGVDKSGSQTFSTMEDDRTSIYCTHIYLHGRSMAACEKRVYHIEESLTDVKASHET